MNWRKPVDDDYRLSKYTRPRHQKPSRLFPILPWSIAALMASLLCNGYLLHKLKAGIEKNRLDPEEPQHERVPSLLAESALSKATGKKWKCEPEPAQIVCKEGE